MRFDRWPLPQSCPKKVEQLDPRQRSDAIESLALRAGQKAREAIARALADPDETVRLLALEQTQVVPGLALSAGDLQDLIRRDESESVRLKAFNIISSDPTIDESQLAIVAQSAQSDLSEQVRMRALDLSHRLQMRDRASPPAIPAMQPLDGVAASDS